MTYNQWQQAFSTLREVYPTEVYTNEQLNDFLAHQDIWASVPDNADELLDSFEDYQADH